ncbi:MAG: hypothetical protein J6B85_00105 [Lachnospiraceae bacterium]|nr:hypothetical protein [Lachnospiraceae bacterium]
MYIIKIDILGGSLYFTGKKQIIQGSEQPGLTQDIRQARQFEDPAKARAFCRMLIERYDMEFYYSELTEEETA